MQPSETGRVAGMTRLQKDSDVEEATTPPT